MAGGLEHVQALAGGYQAAFLVGACFVALAAVLGGLLLRDAPAGAGEAQTATH